MNAIDVAKQELLPLLGTLVALLEEEEASEAAGFFRSVERSFELAQAEEDLAEGFMRLSTSAFLGFHYSHSAAIVLDQILEAAQGLSRALAEGESAPKGTLH